MCATFHVTQAQSKIKFIRFEFLAGASKGVTYKGVNIIPRPFEIEMICQYVDTVLNVFFSCEVTFRIDWINY